MPPLPVTVVGGFLGAGKTTLINRVLRSDHGLRIAVLVNDFGSINVDASLIARSDATTIELTNGCACCAIGDALGDAFHDLLSARERFDHVIVEASGVADPARLARWATLPGLRLDATVVLADSSAVTDLLTDRYVGATVAGQLNAADVIVLTKGDLVDGVASGRSEAAVAEYSSAPTIRSADRDGSFVEVLVGPSEVGPSDRVALLPSSIVDHSSVFVSRAFVPQGTVDVGRVRAEVEAGIDGLLRLKGHVVCADGAIVLIQVVGRRVECSPSTLAADIVQVGVVAIGVAGRVDLDAVEALLS